MITRCELHRRDRGNRIWANESLASIRLRSCWLDMILEEREQRLA
jgi:hypothetical protein